MKRAAGLLAEIAADPDDDAPRQVYADLLVERGDPHGAFIHLQLARSGLPPSKKELKREIALLTGNARNWVGDLASLFAHDDIGNDQLAIHHTCSVGPQWGSGAVRFERGFLASASLRRTSTTVLSQRIAAVATSPWLATIEELSLDVEALYRFSRKALPALRGLDVFGRELADVVASPWAPQLQFLHLRTSLTEVRDNLEQIAKLKALFTLRLEMNDAMRAGYAHRPILERLFAIANVRRVELPHWHYTGTTAVKRGKLRWLPEQNAVSRKLLQAAMR